MIGGSFVDGAIYLYLAYHFLIGFKRGLFNVLVDVFGIYGACFVAWFFQDSVSLFFKSALNLDDLPNSMIVFFGLWFVSYVTIYVFGKFVTSTFKFTGVSLMVRCTGSVLNLSKGIIIVTVILTLLAEVRDSLYEETSASKFFTMVGSNLMTRYNKGLDENVLKPVKASGDYQQLIIEDDFKYNILER